MSRIGGHRGQERSVVRRLAAAALGIGLIFGSTAIALASAPGRGTVVGATPAAAPSTSRVTAAASVPPKPSTSLKTLKVTYNSNGGVVKARITWREPAGTATKFRVLGLLTCPRESRKNEGKPCIVAHTRIKSKDLRVIATVGGSVRSAIFRVKLAAGEGPPTLWDGSDYYAILLGADNRHGESVLAIAASAKVCGTCTGQSQ